MRGKSVLLAGRKEAVAQPIDAGRPGRHDGNGELAGLSDQTDRVQCCACEALVASKAQYATLFRYTRDGIVVMDENGSLVQANRAAKSLLGFEDQRVRGMAFQELLAAPDRDLFMRRLKRLLGEGEPPQEMELLRSDGLRVPVEATAARLPEKRIVLTLRDVRQRRELEKARMQGEKLNALGRLAAGVAHELRNPLFVISNVLHALQGKLEPRSPEILEGLEMALEETRHARGIIDNMLGFVRPVDREGCLLEPAAVIEQVIRLFRASLEDKCIELETDLGESRACHFSPDAFKQVMVNLISNGMDAMPGGGRLRVVAERSENGGVTVSVEDTGRGMSLQERKEIFTPFYSTKKGGRGTGLGLWIVHLTVMQYGGRVHVHSVEGRGTKFSLELAAPGGVNEEPAIEERTRTPHR